MQLLRGLADRSTGPGVEAEPEVLKGDTLSLGLEPVPAAVGSATATVGLQCSVKQVQIIWIYFFTVVSIYGVVHCRRHI